ncbi:hypothetical protein WI61_04985 [Burkholderia cepacia]|uniref:phage tail tip lysozyme n=1 Tax=Burkholderia cepacia TaxID=292 RepID=UPI00075C3541|nr:phage tail tip lysozyme [Burkholderia cepacia]KVA67820.1 hypothetical protein WI48_34555 [Burkholderia cepacia]KVA70700.1 hypothetical protein WI49_35995 [Burkholderia cepacia]KVA76944.1 hypothetical protein WI52_27320 [Burkholderia cepacia]KVA79596.1 hypothetical protein WI51_27290 [Burkholderia cepacia]KVA80736.1 hypothetical protein WI50_26385 [Burkholderia cepacia]
MAVSILKIQVDRAEADQYFKDFKAFDDQLQGMPDAWKDALRQAKLLQAVQLNLQQGQKNQTSGLKDSNKQLTVMEKHWKTIGGTVKGINKDVRDVMSNVSKILPGLGTLGAVTGLVGLPALMFAGFSKLMSSFGADRATNLQMGGISQGSRKAFENTYGRYGFADTQLRAVAEAQRDPNKRAGLIQALTAAGISPQEAAQLSEQGTDAGEVMSRLINASRTANPLVLRAMGGQFITPEQVTTVQSAQAGEIEGLRGEYERQTPELDARAADQRKALEFTSHLSEVFEKIRVGVFNKLIALEPSLDKVAKSFGKLVTNVLDSPGFKRFLDELPARITKFSEFLTSDRFTDALKTVTNDFFKLAVVLTRLTGVIYKLLPGSLTGKYKNPQELLKTTNENIAKEEANLKLAQQRYKEADELQKQGHPFQAAIARTGASPESIRDSLKDLYSKRDELNAQIAAEADANIPNTVNTYSDDGGMQRTALTSDRIASATYVTPDGKARGPATVDEKAQFIGEFIAEGRRRGMKPEAIAGALGSIAQESGYDVFVRNSIGAYGAAQWLSKDRQRALEKFRKEHPAWSEMKVQAAFHWQEAAAQKGLLQKLNSARSIEEAATIHRRDYERPAEAEANDAKRAQYGMQAFNSYGDVMRGTVQTVAGVKVNVVVQNQTGANLTANAAASAT